MRHRCRTIERYSHGGCVDSSRDEPLLTAMADRIVYLCHKGVINRDQAFWRLMDLFRGGWDLAERERIELGQFVEDLLRSPNRRYRSDSTIVAARVPRYVVEHIDHFASAYQLTRSQCVGLALDLVFGQEWQLEYEPWKRTKYGYAGETLPALLNRLEHGSTTGARYRRSPGR